MISWVGPKMSTQLQVHTTPYHTCGDQSACDITEFCSVNMDAWYYRFSVACDTMEFEFSLLSPPLVRYVHSTWPLQAMWHMHAPTFNKWHEKKKKKKNKKVTLHILTHDAKRGCGLPSLVACINDELCDIRERNVTMRREIWTTNIRSVGFQAMIRETRQLVMNQPVEFEK